MRRVLFVDDDPRILGGLERLLRSQRREWEMAFAPGGQAAIDQLRLSSFDVMITDLRMPGIDGVQVLRWAQENCGGMARIVLSGHAEEASVIDVALLAHQFLSKPCDGATLRETVDRVCRLRNTVDSPAVRQVVGSVALLPILPAIWTQLNKLIGDPQSSVGQIAALIEEDVGLAAKVLQLVNSSFFGLGRQVSSIRDAVVLLGVGVLRSVILAAALFEGELARAPGVPVQAVHDQSLLVARAARHLSPGDPDDAFAAGLLHDIGRLVMARVFPPDPTLPVAHGDDPEVWLAEKARLGFTHAEVGGYLLALWGVPPSIVEAVVFHHAAPQLTSRPSNVDAVYLANLMADGRTPPRDYLERLAAAGYLPDLERAQELIDGR